jgi:membrane fusion protein, heavy metal efflux system
VLFVSDILDPDTRRTKVRIAFDNPDKALKPNMFADASFVAPAIWV